MHSFYSSSNVCVCVSVLRSHAQMAIANNPTDQMFDDKEASGQAQTELAELVDAKNKLAAKLAAVRWLLEVMICFIAMWSSLI